jgi:hypothetical protein
MLLHLEPACAVSKDGGVLCPATTPGSPLGRFGSEGCWTAAAAENES